MIDVRSPLFAMIVVEAFGTMVALYGAWSMSRRDRRIRRLEFLLAEEQAREDAARAHPAE